MEQVGIFWWDLIERVRNFWQKFIEQIRIFSPDELKEQYSNFSHEELIERVGHIAADPYTTFCCDTYLGPE
jgi:hypothetical protein